MDCVSKSSCTPKKYIDVVGCIICGSEKADTRKRTKLNGKVSDLQQRICSILQVPSSSVNSNSYICNDRCYRDVNRLEKMQQDLKKLQNSLKESSKQTIEQNVLPNRFYNCSSPFKILTPID